MCDAELSTHKYIYKRNELKNIVINAQYKALFRCYNNGSKVTAWYICTKQDMGREA